MAEQIKYVDLSGLSTYDGKIKDYIDTKLIHVYYEDGMLIYSTVLGDSADDSIDVAFATETQINSLF